ncbi:MAG: Acyl-phosphate glycerol 3-phosphate acyltransferase [Rhodoglobus sp.]|nr:Acyl-phosphate glycerol 3-phosphate acyltransferase [Rhodoglobus sp.]
MRVEGDSAPRTSREKTAIFRTFAYLLIPFMELVGSYRIHGAANLPDKGAVVVSPNHYSDIEPVVIGYAMYKLKRMPRFLAKDSLFRVPVLGWMLAKAGQVPVQRAGSSGAKTLAQARTIAQAGHAVVIYPEGTLTRDPDLWPMRGKFGAVRTALDAGIPLIPAVSWGAQRILPRYGRISFFPRKKVDIVFGPPLDLSKFEGRSGDGKALAEATNLLMNTLAAMVGELREETPPAQRWDPADHGQSEIGRFQ